jgi:uncharacterized peroxidase-related enzyme
MARVNLIEPRGASREVQQIYEHRLGGRPMNLHKAMAHNPQALVPFLALNAAVGKSLERRLWELVYVRVSIINGCEYCVQHLVGSSKKAGLGSDDWKALQASELSRYSDPEQAALKYAEKLTRTPAEVSDADIDELRRHFNEQQIVDLHLLVGLANLTNRFTGPLGLESEFAVEAL